MYNCVQILSDDVIVFIRPERMKTFPRLWYFELRSALKNYKLLKLLHFNKRILYERQLRKRQVDKIVKVSKIFRNAVFKQLQEEYFEDLCGKMCPPSLTNQSYSPVEMNMSVRDLLHENHVAMSVEFKAWTDIHRVRSELDLDLDLGDVMSKFDGFSNVSCQFLDQEGIECEKQDVEDTLTTAEKVPKKNAFSLMMSSKRAFVNEKKGPA